MLSKQRKVLLSLTILMMVFQFASYRSDDKSAYALTVSALGGASTTVNYMSSVDDAGLEYREYLPTGYSPAEAYPMVVLLHGSGGNLLQYDNNAWRQAADAHGYILVTARARMIPGYGTNRASFFMNGALVPAEQDVLDVLPIIKSRYLIDPARIYLGGYSMGGIGTLNIAALNPGVFAAIAPGTAMSDLFQQRAYNAAVPAAPGFDALLGGAPGTSDAIDTLWYQNSPRFLLSNLMNTPTKFLHGAADSFIPNNTSTWPFMESRHIVDVPGFTDARGRSITLQELRLLWPNGYFEEHSWPNTDHGFTSLGWTPEEVLTFFDAHILPSNPKSVGFTTYEDRHTLAFWLQLNLAHPWTAEPGTVFATRDISTNSMQLQVSGSMTLNLDLNSMGLNETSPISIIVQPMTDALPSSAVTLVLTGDWQPGAAYSVSKDGVTLPSTAYLVETTKLTFSQQDASISHVYEITPTIYNLFLPFVLR